MLRTLVLSVICGTVCLGVAAGAAQAAHRGGAPRCMEAVVPSCKAPQFSYCDKKSKCGSCAKWICKTPAAAHI